MSSIYRRILLFLMTGMLLAACSGSRTPQASPAPPDLPAETDSTPTVAPVPTATLTPLTPRLLFLAPQGLPFPYDALPARVDSAAAARGWQVERQDAVPGVALDASVQAVITLPGAGDPLSLAEANPQAPFMLVGVSPDAALPPNAVALDFSGASPENRAFLAGYIAALATADWRVGVIADDPALVEAFRQGAVYFCGLCRPAYPPFAAYPAYAEIPGGASADVWYSAFAAFSEQGVETVYIAPPLLEEEIPVTLLPDTDFRLITESPPPDALSARWLASVYPDVPSAFDAAWDALLSGERGQRLPVPLTFAVGNPEWFSEGRQRLARQVADALAEGAVSVR